MGTNYYLRTSADESSDVHIGKYSHGWVFQFNGQVHKSFDEWAEFIRNRPGNIQIIDDYNRVYAPGEFLFMVKNTLKPGSSTGKYPEHNPKKNQKNWTSQGYMFSNYNFC